MVSCEPTMSEALIFDGDEKVQDGLSALVREAGLTPMVLTDPGRALDRCGEQQWVVALVDWDTPTVGGGMALISELHRRSPTTKLVLLLARPDFEAAVAGLRAGVRDVVVKSPAQLDYLRERVVEAARGSQAEPGALLKEALTLEEDLLKELATVYRKAVDSDPRFQSAAELETAVLVVDNEPGLEGQLAALWQGRSGLKARVVISGGEALDLAARGAFQIVLVKEGLPDLPGSMVVRTIKASSPETMVLHYSMGPGGKVAMVEPGDRTVALPELGDRAELFARLEDLIAASRATQRERRIQAAFREEHRVLLRRLSEWKRRAK